MDHPSRVCTISASLYSHPRLVTLSHQRPPPSTILYHGVLLLLRGTLHFGVPGRDVYRRNHSPPGPVAPLTGSKSDGSSKVHVREYTHQLGSSLHSQAKADSSILDSEYGQ